MVSRVLLFVSVWLTVWQIIKICEKIYGGRPTIEYKKRPSLFDI